jgi:hypothetical protein
MDHLQAKVDCGLPCCLSHGCRSFDAILSTQAELLSFEAASQSQYPLIQDEITQPDLRTHVSSSSLYSNIGADGKVILDNSDTFFGFPDATEYID